MEETDNWDWDGFEGRISGDGPEAHGAGGDALVASPVARSLAHLRAAGFWVDTVEHWNSFAKVRRDLWGVGDLLAFDARQTLLVQCTTAENLAAREKKVRKWAGLADWLVGGRRFLLHGWALRGERGKRKTWQCVQREVRL